jgi:hypothetical protein
VNFRSSLCGSAVARSPLITIILVNLMPLVGVLFFGWQIGHVVIVFWLESIMIGFFNLLRMIFARGERDGVRPRGKAGTALFFLVHYFGFMLGQGFFILAFVLAKEDFMQIGSLNLPLVFAGLLLFYSFNFISDFILTGEFQRRTHDFYFFRPYGRVFIQQVLILGGGWLIASGKLSREVAFTILLVGMKILVDLAIYGFSFIFGSSREENINALRG